MAAGVTRGGPSCVGRMGGLADDHQRIAIRPAGQPSAEHRLGGIPASGLERVAAELDEAVVERRQLVEGRRHPEDDPRDRPIEAGQTDGAHPRQRQASDRAPSSAGSESGLARLGAEVPARRRRRPTPPPTMATSRTRATITSTTASTGVCCRSGTGGRCRDRSGTRREHCQGSARAGHVELGRPGDRPRRRRSGRSALPRSGHPLPGGSRSPRWIRRSCSRRGRPR